MPFFFYTLLLTPNWELISINLLLWKLFVLNVIQKMPISMDALMFATIVAIVGVEIIQFLMNKA